MKKQPKKRANLFLNQSDLAEIFGKSRKHIASLVEAGMPREGHGKRGSPWKFFLPEVWAWYEKYSRENLASEGSRTELVREQTRRLKLENDETEERLIPVESVEILFLENVALLVAQLESAPGRIAGGNAVLRERLLKEFRRIRESTADAMLDLAQKFHPESPQ